MKTSSELDVLRSKIDDIDEQIIMLLAYRFEVSEEIGEIKKATGGKSLDPARFAQVLEQAKKLGKEHSISQTCIDTIWQAIHLESMAHQK